METSGNQSALEVLPDEILLEVCKYLLCTDILQSFIGLNYRLTQMITRYRHHLSFHKTSVSKFNHLCMNVLPQTGSQIRSLVIDCCYSLLQDQLFVKHFGEKMSIMFPNLERISLVAHQHDNLIRFLSTLHDLTHLDEIRLYSLFSIPKSQQSTFVRSLFQANNHRLTTILTDDRSSPLSFDDSDCYLNIFQLHIKLKTIADLISLFTVVPNVRSLEVILIEGDPVLEYVNLMKFPPLLHLTNFQLKSTMRIWKLEELCTIFGQLPIVQCLSLFLTTYDQRLIQGDTILSSLPSTVQQFNYAIYFLCNTTLNEDDTIVSSWPTSHPVASYFSNEFLFLHTFPWHFGRFEILSSVGKMMSCQTNNALAYDRQIEQLDFKIDKNLTFSKSLAVLSQCRRVREIIIAVKNDEDVVKEQQLPVSRLSKLSRLIQISFYGSIPSDLNHFSSILNAAPNLFRLDLPFGHLLKLIENQEICHLLDQRITSLSICENKPNSSFTTLNEEHISIIASVFSRIRDMYVNIIHLPCSTNVISHEDIVEGSLQQNVSIEACQQKDAVISPCSSESMLLCLLTKFKEYRFLSLCVDGLFIETIKTDTEHWLRTNTLLREQQFKAAFNNDSNRLFIWM